MITITLKNGRVLYSNYNRIELATQLYLSLFGDNEVRIRLEDNSIEEIPYLNIANIDFK